MTLSFFLAQILNGLSIGSVYAIFALGYTLVFSILGIINFAHGAIFTLGAYFTYALIGGAFGFNGILANAKLPFGLPFIVALLLASFLAGLVGVAIEQIAFRPLRLKRADPLLSVVSSLGVALVIINLVQYLVGAESYTFPDSILAGFPAAINFGTLSNPIMIRSVQILIFFVSVLILLILSYWINYTKYGQALKAIAEDQITAGLLGINTDLYIVITFFISSFIAGLSGTLVGLSVSIAGPYFGMSFGLKGLAVIVLGGLGSISGAVVGGFIIGMAEAFVPSEYSAYKEAIAFGILFLMLLIKPQGLFGQKIIQKV